MELEKKLQFYREFVADIHDLWYWCYDHEFNLQYTNCNHSLFFNSLFSVSGRREAIMEHARKSKLPLVIADALNLMWIAVFEKNGEDLNRIHLIGPAYTDKVSQMNADSLIKPYNVPMASRKDVIQFLQAAPVVERVYFFQYALVLHLCVTDEKIDFSEICYIESKDINFNASANTMNFKQLRDTWGVEESLLKMVRDGNLNYQDILNQATMVSNGISLVSTPQLRQAKDSCIIFISLCKRAAIEGGLSAETADILCNTYIDKVESCSTISGATAISKDMYSDFIHRVHNCKKNSRISKQIQSCLDYIRMHIEEPLSVKELAGRVGYTDYYLTRKFKNEVGCSIIDFIKQERMEQAKLLLTTTQRSIQDISECLHFCTRSYFAETFQKITGMSPSEYRAKHIKL